MRLIILPLIPVSSFTSLRAVCSIDLPLSISPPGSVQYPLNGFVSLFTRATSSPLTTTQSDEAVGFAFQSRFHSLSFSLFIRFTPKILYESCHRLLFSGSLLC